MFGFFGGMNQKQMIFSAKKLLGLNGLKFDLDKKEIIFQLGSEYKKLSFDELEKMINEN